MNIEAFLRDYGLLAVFCVMMLKEFGVPVPIPADLIMLGVASQTATGQVPIVAGFLVLLIPMLIGGSFQFLVARAPGRATVYRLGRFIGLTQARLDAMMARVRKGGSAAVAVGLTTPGLRIATTPASGLANLAPRTFAPGLALGSAFFLAWHFAIGYAGGAALTALNVSPAAIAALLVAVLGFGFAVALVKRRRNKRAALAHPTLESYASWADASCPVCATLNLLQKDGLDGHDAARETAQPDAGV